MTNKKRLYIFFASALLLAVLVLLLFAALGNNKSVDKNGMFKIDNMWFEQQQELTDENVQRFIKKLNTLQTDYLTSNNKVYYSIVPDKSYYIADSGYPVPDYANAIESVSSGVTGKYIDITSALSLADYYTTDPHWRQERLQGVLEQLGREMGFSVDIDSFTPVQIDNFLGSYAKNLPHKLAGENLIYLENESTKNNISLVFGSKDFEEMPVYNTEKLSGKTPYDIFLSGTSPLITIENPNTASDKQLIIFRDSYASSLTPLLIDKYQKITLVDLRYMASVLLPDYIDFDNQDVLFLYSTSIIANSLLLR